MPLLMIAARAAGDPRNRISALPASGSLAAVAMPAENTVIFCTSGGNSPTISTLSDKAWVAVNTIMEESLCWEVIPRLKAANATGIVEYPLNKVVM